MSSVINNYLAVGDELTRLSVVEFHGIEGKIEETIQLVEESR